MLARANGIPHCPAAAFVMAVGLQFNTGNSLSRTSMRERPPFAIVIVTSSAPASIEFSTSSLS